MARTADGLELSVTRARVAAEWTPGLPLTFEAAIEDLAVSGSGASAGPLTLRLPAPGPTGADLGLGAAPQQVWALLRVLVLHALQAWGGDGARAVARCSGSTRLAPLEPPDPDDLRSLLADPGGLLRDRLRDLLLSADPTTGEPLVERALSDVLALLRGEVSQAADGFAARLDVTVTAPAHTRTRGRSRWRPPTARSSTSSPGWTRTAHRRVGPCRSPRRCAERPTPRPCSRCWAAWHPSLDDLPAWPGPEQAAGLDALSEWLAASDGVVALPSQLPALPGWTEQLLPPYPHGALPSAPEAIEAIAAQVATWAAEDGAASPVLLLGPAWTTHAIWDDLLAAAGTPGANFDLRGGADPAAVTAVATHYTAELDASPGATLDALAGQAAVAADQIVALTPGRRPSWSSGTRPAGSSRARSRRRGHSSSAAS